MADQPTNTTATQQRVIRVFISSTFRDMHAEREELVKRIFPQLRKLCEQRGVTWGEVDLRWGVTDEQKAEGKVLPICLAEIHNCRPYFIGLLGERYGWLPDKIPPELVEQEPWLSEHRHRSVTELEILHGVLNNPETGNHAFFYLRDSKYVDSLPAEQQAIFREIPTPEEIEQLGAKEAGRQADERKQKLAALKDRIRASGFPVREDYSDPKALGELVLRDLTEVINRLYPEGSQPDPLDREAAEHEAFAASRAKVYIGRQEYFDRLNAHVQSDDPPLVVLGESGMGKSALLANWAIHYRASHSDEIVVLHFIGASPHSADWAAMLRRIMGELKRHFGIQQEIPDQPDALRTAFAQWLHMAAAKGRVILILDALNQLEDRDGAPDLVWLPPVIPANVRLILSTLPGRPLEDLTKRGWPTLEVKPLESDERRRLIKNYLEQYRKALSPVWVEYIAKAGQTANPLYLRALLEELRIYGDHFTLTHHIDDYLAASTVADLYEKILERYEQNYERNRPGLVRDAMSLLWAARRGLTESELLDLLGSNGKPLPQAHWSPLHLAAEQSLVSCSGLVGFFHGYIRQAIQDKYISSEKAKRAVRKRLCNYFEDSALSMRKVDELPWQLAEIGDWQRLSSLLVEPRFLCVAWGHDSYAVREYWSRVEANSRFRMVESYRDILDDPNSCNRIVVCLVAMLLDTAGHRPESLSLWKALAVRAREAGRIDELVEALTNVGNLLISCGDLNGAMHHVKEAERVTREHDRPSGLAAALGVQGSIHHRQGRLKEAMKFHQEAARIYDRLRDRGGWHVAVANQAAIHHSQGNWSEALKLYEQAENVCKELGNWDEMQRAVANQAVIYRALREYNRSLASFEKAETICRKFGYIHGLQRSLGNQAIIHDENGRLDRALQIVTEQEKVCILLNDPLELSICLGIKARVFERQDKLDKALDVLQTKERVCRKFNDKRQVVSCLARQAAICLRLGRNVEYERLIREAEQYAKEE